MLADGCSSIGRRPAHVRRASLDRSRYPIRGSMGRNQDSPSARPVVRGGENRTAPGVERLSGRFFVGVVLEVIAARGSLLGTQTLDDQSRAGRRFAVGHLHLGRCRPPRLERHRPRIFGPDLFSPLIVGRLEQRDDLAVLERDEVHAGDASRAELPAEDAITCGEFFEAFWGEAFGDEFGVGFLDVDADGVDGGLEDGFKFTFGLTLNDDAIGAELVDGFDDDPDTESFHAMVPY